VKDTGRMGICSTAPAALAMLLCCCYLPRCSQLACRRLDPDESLPPADLLPCWLGLAVASAGHRGRGGLPRQMPARAGTTEVRYGGGGQATELERRAEGRRGRAGEARQHGAVQCGRRRPRVSRHESDGAIQRARRAPSGSVALLLGWTAC
jgi:hypothetical protein